MNKLLVVAVLVALAALSAEGFRVPREVDALEEEVEQGTFTRITGAIRSKYNNVVNTASGYLDQIRGMKLEEKVKNFYTETTSILDTYIGIAKDQLYYTVHHEQ